MIKQLETTDPAYHDIQIVPEQKHPGMSGISTTTPRLHDLDRGCWCKPDVEPAVGSFYMEVRHHER